jgi:hypothetical protein
VELLERVREHARKVLVVSGTQGRTDLWLWEHSLRVSRLAERIADLPEYASQSPDRLAAVTAALFASAGWALQVTEGSVDSWQMLGRATSDVQRELAAATVQEELAALLPAATVQRAADALRQCNDRYTDLVEAQIVADAENLADIGLAQVLRQFRQYQAEGRPLDLLLSKWQRQKEYRYWDARVNDCLRSERLRAIARVRLQAVERFMDALARELAGEDVGD